MKRVVAIYGKTFSKNFKSPNYFQESYPWLKGEILLYLGEIEDMPGHGAFCRDGGEIHYGYHLNYFIPLKTIKDPEYDNFEKYFEKKKDSNNPNSKNYLCMTTEGLMKYRKDAMK